MEAATEAPPTIRIDENRKHVYLTSENRKLAIKAWGKQSPPMVCDPTGKINMGKPTSVYDLIYTARTGQKLSAAQHAVPQKDGHDDFDTIEPTEFVVYTSRDLNGKYPNTAKPGPVTNVLNLNQVEALRHQYWIEDLTLEQIADKYKLSVPTARKYIFGELVWYA